MKILSEKQQEVIREKLLTSIRNMDDPDIQSLRRAAVILYSINKKGFLLPGIELRKILTDEKDGSKKFHPKSIEMLELLADAYYILIQGLKNKMDCKFALSKSELK